MKSKEIKTEKKNSKTVKAKVKGNKPIILEAKWTNYSPQFLEHKFCLPKDLNLVESRDIYQIDTSYQNIHLQPLPDITAFNLGNPYEEYSSSCSSPRDVNEISMHISLMETQGLMIEDLHCLQENILVDGKIMKGADIGDGGNCWEDHLKNLPNI